jgi:cell wall-associated NlpC family hydrolase
MQSRCLRTRVRRPGRTEYLEGYLVAASLVLALGTVIGGCASVGGGPASPPSAARATAGFFDGPRSERSARAPEVVIEAMALIGVPYRNGGESPQTGMDCSGFVRYVFRAALGVDLPRRAVDLGEIGESVRPSELQAGDLVFFNTLGRAHSHVGIYVGEGRFVHAPSQRGVVRMEEISKRYWIERFDGVRRLS